MRDKWINSGYDGKELKPFSEPVEDLNDTSRIGRNKPLFNWRLSLVQNKKEKKETCFQYSSKFHFKVLLLNALWHFYDKSTKKSRHFVLASCSSQAPSNPNPQDSRAVCQCGISAGLIYMSFVSDVMVGMGFTREEVKESLNNQKYNEVTATYLLLARKNEVSRITKRADVINTHH